MISTNLCKLIGPHRLPKLMYRLVDPYGEPQLHVRRPGSDEYEVIPTPGDDPYQTEMNHFIDTVRHV